MSNLTKLEFEPLGISGKNYLSWVVDSEIHLDAKNLVETLQEGNKSNNQDKAKAMIFLRHHLHEGLKKEYLTVKDPKVLWNELYHQKTVILPQARFEWMNLRLQDFKSVSEYNSDMFRITSLLKLCGEQVTDSDMLEKTYSTFHANNVVLQTQYREKGFKKYSELISCLLVAEQNNELLMKNHASRPTGSTAFPESNAICHTGKIAKAKNHASYNGQGRRRDYGRERDYDYVGNSGCGRGRGRTQGYGGRGRGSYFKRSYTHNKWERKDNNKPGKNNGENVTSKCHRCGLNGHWAQVCRAPKHWADLYQQTMKQKGNNVETNMVYEDGEGDYDTAMTTHLEVGDFLNTSNPKENN